MCDVCEQSRRIDPKGRLLIRCCVQGSLQICSGRASLGLTMSDRPVGDTTQPDERPVRHSRDDLRRLDESRLQATQPQPTDRCRGCTRTRAYCDALPGTCCTHCGHHSRPPVGDTRDPDPCICGHDEDEHTLAGCDSYTPTWPRLVRCPCTEFQPDRIASDNPVPVDEAAVTDLLNTLGDTTQPQPTDDGRCKGCGAIFAHKPDCPGESPADIAVAEIRALHQQNVPSEVVHIEPPYCVSCLQPWPCETATALDKAGCL